MKIDFSKIRLTFYCFRLEQNWFTKNEKHLKLNIKFYCITQHTTQLHSSFTCLFLFSTFYNRKNSSHKWTQKSKKVLYAREVVVKIMRLWVLHDITLATTLTETFPRSIMKKFIIGYYNRLIFVRRIRDGNLQRIESTNIFYEDIVQCSKIWFTTSFSHYFLNRVINLSSLIKTSSLTQCESFFFQNWRRNEKFTLTWQHLMDDCLEEVFAWWVCSWMLAFSWGVPREEFSYEKFDVVLLKI